MKNIEDCKEKLDAVFYHQLSKPNKAFPKFDARNLFEFFNNINGLDWQEEFGFEFEIDSFT